MLWVRGIPLVLVLSAALAAPAQALHCNGTITTIPAGAETIYMDDRSNTPGQLNHWFYLESNGQPGLQTGGWHAILPECSVPLSCSFDPCQHIDPDALLI